VDRWPFLWDGSCLPPRATYPDDDPETGQAPSLFGLAPGGACRAIPVAGDAVRSYRTISTLPVFAFGFDAASRLRLATPWRAARRRAVSFLWRFPWGRPRRMLSVTVFPWSPDFPLFSLRTKAAIRPSDAPWNLSSRAAMRKHRAMREPRRSRTVGPASAQTPPGTTVSSATVPPPHGHESPWCRTAARGCLRASPEAESRCSRG